MKRAFFAFFSLLLAASILFTFAASAGSLGDFDGNGNVTSDDAVYLLRHTLFPEYYPVTDFADFDHNDNITSDDAVYLLRHTLFPDYYPLIGGDDQIEYAEGLAYEVYDDGETCTIIGIGTFEGEKLNIPPEIDGYKVTSIGNSAFEDCSSLTSVTIPDSVTSIGECAFFGCKGLADKDGFVILKSILFDYYGGDIAEIPEDVTSIGNGAFSGCDGLVSVSIPDSVTNICWGAFMFCSSLTSITISNGVMSIGDYAFYACTGLTEINFTGTKAQWENIEKGDCWNESTGEYVIHCSDGDIE